MSAQSDQLKERTISFAVAMLRLIDQFPHAPAAMVIGHQFAKGATSVGANYRAACSARSKSEFIAKLQIVVEEEESVYWLEVIERSQPCLWTCAGRAPKRPSCVPYSPARYVQLVRTCAITNPAHFRPSPINAQIAQSMTKYLNQ